MLQQGTQQVTSTTDRQETKRSTLHYTTKIYPKLPIPTKKTEIYTQQKKNNYKPKKPYELQNGQHQSCKIRRLHRLANAAAGRSRRLHR